MIRVNMIFGDLSDRTKGDSEPRYKVICDVVLGGDM